MAIRGFEKQALIGISQHHPPPLTPSLSSETKIAKWVMAATMTTIYDEDDNEYDELLFILLTRKCQSEKWIATVKRLLYGRIRGSGFVGQ